MYDWSDSGFEKASSFLVCNNCTMNCLLFQVLDFFNSRIDAQKLDGEWSVEKVLQLIIDYSRSWRGEGMKVWSKCFYKELTSVFVTFVMFYYLTQLVSLKRHLRNYVSPTNKRVTLRNSSFHTCGNWYCLTGILPEHNKYVLNICHSYQFFIFCCLLCLFNLYSNLHMFNRCRKFISLYFLALWWIQWMLLHLWRFLYTSSVSVILIM